MPVLKCGGHAAAPSGGAATALQIYDRPVGKAEVSVIVVPRAVTAAILILVSAAMVALIYFLSGHATMNDRVSLPELVSLIRRYDRGSISNVAVFASVAPAIADILLFLPWGALAFLTVYADNRRGQTYLLTLAAGVAFALGLVAWQNRLPTRVTGLYDAAWSCVGCLAGAILGDLRKRVRIRFE